jgi:hypothetical protein
MLIRRPRYGFKASNGERCIIHQSWLGRVARISDALAGVYSRTVEVSA